ncbi:hypothetical protein LUZ60_001006 [Juncus effusus]|nr:hypothetical protein LUZ60_001006 [Juncus effusus]
MPILDRKFLSLDHHRHPLIFMEFNSRYKCDGCREPGLHSGYCCDHCNFVLHEQCIQSFGDHFRFNRFPRRDFIFAKRLEFVIRRTKKIELAICDVCAKPINGYAYAENTRDGVNIHPSCATLPPSIYNGKMNLVRDIESNCFWCGYGRLPGLRHSWAYISMTEQIHIGCVKDLFLEYSKGGKIFGGTLAEGNSYPALLPRNSNLIATIRPSEEHTCIRKSNTIRPSKHHTSIPNSTAIVPSAGPSSSKSNTIRPRKEDKIKKKAKAIGHAVAAVLGPLAKIVSVGAAIAALIPLL